ncbi:hypothetical protein BJX63DRAFT_432835 [Aspergillus granulosus]|uniref:Uncharacterized protein n=1 Tax=Aspergillus granulosus TaxID=176169 RepID=A0ABR4H9R4_9EURO
MAPAAVEEDKQRQTETSIDYDKYKYARYLPYHTPGLLAAERGVVLFRDQDFADIGPERQCEFGRHFGPL